MFQPRLTVITIVFNNVRDIERTMLSVLNQTYPNLEYIIVDGKSTDGTLEVIKKYERRISRIVSEPDRGIYDAMNKGLALATGDYVLFMNSGDEVYAADTVARIFSLEPDADIYYGETEMYNQQWQSIGRRRHRAPDKLTWRSFQYGMSVSHQAIYVKRSITVPFDTAYHLSSDIDWIIKALKKAGKVVNANMYVAKYLVGGMSKAKHKQSLVERFEIFTKHYGFIPNVLNHLLIAMNLGIYYLRHGRSND